MKLQSINHKFDGMNQEFLLSIKHNMCNDDKYTISVLMRTVGHHSGLHRSTGGKGSACAAVAAVSATVAGTGTVAVAAEKTCSRLRDLDAHTLGKQPEQEKRREGMRNKKKGRKGTV